MGRIRYPPLRVKHPVLCSTNYLADLSLPEKYINDKEYNSYKDILQFLQSHPLQYALTARPIVMYPDMLKEFWNTCEYHQSKNHISGTVFNGSKVIGITIKGLRDTLRLPRCIEFDPLVSDAEAKETLHKIWYVRDKTKRLRLPAMWKYLSGIVMRSFAAKVGKYDQAGPMERQILHSLVTGANIDYAELIFNDLKKKVLESHRDNYVPYPRFFSLVFQKIMGNEYIASLYGSSYFTPFKYDVLEFNHKIFKDVEGDDAELTSPMKSMIKNPYVHPPSDLKADSSDSEADSTSHCKSTLSPLNSSNSMLASISEVIPPKTNPTPPSETSASQLSKSPSRNKPSETETSDKGQHIPSKVTSTTATLEAVGNMDIDNHEPVQDAYFTPSPYHNHHSSPNTTRQDPPTDTVSNTDAIIKAIMALTSKVDTISSDVESLKCAMGTLQTNTTIQHNILAQELATLKSQTQNYDTISSDVESVKYAMGTLQTNTTIQHNILAQELITLKSQIQNHVSPKTPCSPPSHSSAQGLTSQMSALESEMKAINHTLDTLQDNTTTSVADLTKGIDQIKRQHFYFSMQLENVQNLQHKVHTAALNTETAMQNLDNLCVSVQTSLANSSKALESLEAKVEASQPAFSEVQSGAVISKYLLDNLNDQVNKLAKVATSQKPSQQSAIPFSKEDDSETIRLLNKRNVEKPAQEEPAFKKQITVETWRKANGKNIMPGAQQETEAVNTLVQLKGK